MADADTTLQQLKNRMREFVDERDWQQFHTAKNLAASVSIEAAELLELFQWLSESKVEDSLANPEFRSALSDEVADVILYLLSFANKVDLDISDAVSSKLQKNRVKYPVEAFKGRFTRSI